MRQKEKMIEEKRGGSRRIEAGKNQVITYWEIHSGKKALGLEYTGKEGTR